LFIIGHQLAAQNLGEWVFGDGASLTFTSNGLIKEASKNELLVNVVDVAAITVLDSTNNLLFYFDGIHLRDKNHDTIAGGGDFDVKTGYDSYFKASVLFYPSKIANSYYLIH